MLSNYGSFISPVKPMKTTLFPPEKMYIHYQLQYLARKTYRFGYNDIWQKAGVNAMVFLLVSVAAISR